MSTAPGPLVSVVVTCFEHERFVEQALDSLAAQTYPHFEVVVVDDCSTDGSVARVRSWIAAHDLPVQLIAHERNLGVCAARNAALARCRGEFVASLSADDWYEPDKLARQVAHFATLDDDVSSVFGDMALVDEHGAAIGSFYPDFVPSDARVDGWIFSALLRRNFLPAPTVMTRRRAFAAVGPYDESLSYDDADMWLRLAHRFRFSYLPGTVVQHRVLGASLSRDPDRRLAHLRSTARLLSKWLGDDPVTDQVIRERLWSTGVSAFLLDAPAGRAILREPGLTQGRPSRRWFLRATAVPGSQAAARAAARRRQARRRARPGAGKEAGEAPVPGR